MEIEDKIREFVQGTLTADMPNVSITDDGSLFAQGVIDSLTIIQLLAFADAEFGIQIASVDVNPENFDSINRLAAYVRRKLREPMSLVQS